jgi:hypothetical protein
VQAPRQLARRFSKLKLRPGNWSKLKSTEHGIKVPCSVFFGEQILIPDLGQCRISRRGSELHTELLTNRFDAHATSSRPAAPKQVLGALVKRSWARFDGSDRAEELVALLMGLENRAGELINDSKPPFFVRGPSENDD